MDLKEIEDKRMELVQIQIKYKKEIEEMQWQYIKENFNLEKGNVLKYKDKHCVIDSIGILFNKSASFSCSVIKKDTTIGKNTAYVYSNDVEKVFNCYEEYKQALKNL